MPDRFVVANFPRPGMFIHFRRGTRNWVLRVETVTSHSVIWFFIEGVSTVEEANLHSYWVKGHTDALNGIRSWQKFISGESGTHVEILNYEKKRKWRM